MAAPPRALLAEKRRISSFAKVWRVRPSGNGHVNTSSQHSIECLDPMLRHRVFGAHSIVTLASVVDDVRPLTTSRTRRWRGDEFHMRAFTDESRPSGGFTPAETLELNSTAGDYGTAGGTLSQPVLSLLVG